MEYTLTNCPKFRDHLSTQVTVNGQGFNEYWQGTSCDFSGTCSSGPGNTFYGGGPNSGYLCDAGGPGCGSDGFVPSLPNDVFNNPVFNNPYQNNLTAGMVDPFGGADNIFQDPRGGEPIEYDPNDPPEKIKKALELNSAYVNGEILYPFFEGWENRPKSDFDRNNPDAVGGPASVPESQQRFGPITQPTLSTAPIAGGGQLTISGENFQSFISNHPYRNNLTSGAFDPFGGGEGIFQDPRTGALIEFDPENPPDEIKKAMALNDAYANGEINYPFYEDWRNRPIEDFDPDKGDIGGVPNPGTLGGVASNVGEFFAYDPSHGGGVQLLNEGFLSPGAETGVFRDGDEVYFRPTIVLDNGLRISARMEFEGEAVSESEPGITNRGASFGSRAYLQNFFAYQPPVNEPIADSNSGGASGAQPSETSFLQTIIDNVPDAFKVDEDSRGGPEFRSNQRGPFNVDFNYYKFTLPQQSTGNTNLQFEITRQNAPAGESPAVNERYRAILRGDVRPTVPVNDPSVARPSALSDTEIRSSQRPFPNAGDEAKRTGTAERPANATGVRPSVPPAPTGEKVGEIAYQKDGQRFIVDVIRTTTGSMLAVGTGQNAGHVFGTAKEGKWGYAAKARGRRHPPIRPRRPLADRRQQLRRRKPPRPEPAAAIRAATVGIARSSYNRRRFRPEPITLGCRSRTRTERT